MDVHNMCTQRQIVRIKFLHLAAAECKHQWNGHKSLNQIDLSCWCRSKSKHTSGKSMHNMMKHLHTLICCVSELWAHNLSQSGLSRNGPKGWVLLQSCSKSCSRNVLDDDPV